MRFTQFTVSAVNSNKIYNKINLSFVNVVGEWIGRRVHRGSNAYQGDIAIPTCTESEWMCRSPTRIICYSLEFILQSWMKFSCWSLSENCKPQYILSGNYFCAVSSKNTLNFKPSEGTSLVTRGSSFPMHSQVS